jgi:hypothetical protein
MSKTSNENQNAPAAPLPTDDEENRTTSEPSLESELARTPTPNQATNPTIKNT